MVVSSWGTNRQLILKQTHGDVKIMDHLGTLVKFSRTINWKNYFFNPFKPNAIFHCYQLDQFISV